MFKLNCFLMQNWQTLHKELPKAPSMCTNIRFSVTAQTGNKLPPESRGWERTWTVGREPERGTQDHN